jgi:hypothetical protein
LPVVGELGAEALERAPVRARPQTFDGFAGDHFQVTEFLENLRREVVEIGKVLGHGSVFRGRETGCRGRFLSPDT